MRFPQVLSILFLLIVASLLLGFPIYYLWPSDFDFALTIDTIITIFGIFIFSGLIISLKNEGYRVPRVLWEISVFIVAAAYILALILIGVFLIVGFCLHLYEVGIVILGAGILWLIILAVKSLFKLEEGI